MGIKAPTQIVNKCWNTSAMYIAVIRTSIIALLMKSDTSFQTIPNKHDVRRNEKQFDGGFIDGIRTAYDVIPLIAMHICEKLKNEWHAL